MEILDIILRWLHISAAIVAVGGAIFMRYVLMPSAAALPEAAHDELREGVRKRFAGLLMASIAILLVTGFVNYIKNEVPAHKGDALYHALLGTKIILAFGVFFLGSALVGRSAAFEKIRRNRGRWLAVNILLALIVVALGSVLRSREDTTMIDAPDMPTMRAGADAMSKAG